MKNKFKFTAKNFIIIVLTVLLLVVVYAYASGNKLSDGRVTDEMQYHDMREIVVDSDFNSLDSNENGVPDLSGDVVWENSALAGCLLAVDNNGDTVCGTSWENPHGPEYLNSTCWNGVLERVWWPYTGGGVAGTNGGFWYGENCESNVACPAGQYCSKPACMCKLSCGDGIFQRDGPDGMRGTLDDELCDPKDPKNGDLLCLLTNGDGSTCTDSCSCTFPE